AGDARSADERAWEIRADLDHVPADGLEVVHVIEAGDRLAVRGRQVERLGNLAQRLGRQPPLRLLGKPECRHDRRPAIGIERRDPLHLPPEMRSIFGGSQRSTSPITVSSEPTIAIMSAIKDSRMHVAVASSATNEGARNFTRHGRGPPSETT